MFTKTDRAHICNKWKIIVCPLPARMHPLWPAARLYGLRIQITINGSRIITDTILTGTKCWWKIAKDKVPATFNITVEGRLVKELKVPLETNTPPSDDVVCQRSRTMSRNWLSYNNYNMSHEQTKFGSQSSVCAEYFSSLANGCHSKTVPLRNTGTCPDPRLEPSKQCWPWQLELSPSSSSSSSSSSLPTSSPCTQVPLQTILFHVSDFLGGAHSRFSRVHKSFFSNSHSNRDFFRSNAFPRKCLERVFSFWK